MVDNSDDKSQAARTTTVSFKDGVSTINNQTAVDFMGSKDELGVTPEASSDLMSNSDAKSPLAPRPSRMRERFAEFTRERAKRTASTGSHYGLQYKAEDFEDQLDGGLTPGSSSSDLNIPNYKSAESTADLPTRSGMNIARKGTKEKDKGGDDGSIGAIDEDLMGEGDDNDRDGEIVGCMSKRAWKRFWKYVFPLLLSLVVLCVGAVFDYKTNLASVSSAIGISLFGVSAMVAIACFTVVLAQALVYLFVKVYIRRVHTINYKLNYSLRGSNKSMSFALWSGIMMVVVYFVPWNCLTLPPGSPCVPENASFMSGLQKFLFYLCLCGAVFVVRLYFLKNMTFEFHQTAYLERLKDFYFSEYVLSRLLVPAPSIFAALQVELTDMHDSIGVAAGNRLRAKTKASGSSLKDFTNAQDLADEIWWCVADGKEVLRPQDFELFIAKKHRARAFNLFDSDNSGDVTMDEIQKVVKKYMRERRNLRLSVQDHRTIVNKLSHAFTFGAMAVCFLIFLLLFADLAQQFVVPALTTIAAFTFIFGTYAQKTFENAAFIFQQHPFDVGDRVFIDGENLIVNAIEFSRTVFDRWDGHRITYPNTLLREKVITNVRRSGPMSSFFTFHVYYGVTNKALLEFEKRLRAFIAENSKDFFPETGVDVKDIQQDFRAVLIFSVKHRDNWQDGKLRWSRHSKVGYFARATLEELGIMYFPPPQNVEVKKVSEFRHNPFGEVTSSC